MLQSKRAKARADLVYRSAKPGQVPASAEQRDASQRDKTRQQRGGQGREAGKARPERFYLDEIQNKYQGLDPQEARKKVCIRLELD